MVTKVNYCLLLCIKFLIKKSDSVQAEYTLWILNLYSARFNTKG